MNLSEQLIGTWQLIEQRTEYPDGRIDITRGEKPVGILMYDAHGNMSVQLLRTAEPVLQHTDLTSFETAMDQYHGYFGTYDVDEAEKVVYHNIIGAAFPPYIGTKQKRHVTLDGNRLKLYAHATTKGDDTARYIVWERLLKKGQ